MRGTFARATPSHWAIHFEIKIRPVLLNPRRRIVQIVRSAWRSLLVWRLFSISALRLAPRGRIAYPLRHEMLLRPGRRQNGRIRQLPGRQNASNIHRRIDGAPNRSVRRVDRSLEVHGKFFRALRNYSAAQRLHVGAQDRRCGKRLRGRRDCDSIGRNVLERIELASRCVRTEMKDSTAGSNDAESLAFVTQKTLWP